MDPESEEYLTAALAQMICIHMKAGTLDEGIALIQKHLPDAKE